jgi:hypothetical protein
MEASGITEVQEPASNGTVSGIEDIPVSESIRPRPVYRRFLERMHFMPMDPPSEKEIVDAIAVLRDLHPPVLELDEVLLMEAERIFVEAGIEGAE